MFKNIVYWYRKGAGISVNKNNMGWVFLFSIAFFKFFFQNIYSPLNGKQKYKRIN